MMVGWHHNLIAAVHDLDNSQDKFIIAKQNTGLGYQFMSMKNELEAYAPVEKSFRGDRVYNEVIIRDSPSRVYFDLDLKMK